MAEPFAFDFGIWIKLGLNEYLQVTQDFVWLHRWNPDERKSTGTVLHERSSQKGGGE